MAANKQHMAADAAMISSILIMVDPPFGSFVQPLDLVPIQTQLSVRAFAAVYLYL